MRRGWGREEDAVRRRVRSGKPGVQYLRQSERGSKDRRTRVRTMMGWGHLQGR